MAIPFNRASIVGREIDYVNDAVERGHLAADGYYTELCNKWLADRTGAKGALLTHSATGALEMGVILADVNPGDEVILPSYTFCSTATAVVMRGAVPVFVDIREDTLNIDESLIEAALTERTKAILPIHYAGVGAAMPEIMEIARKNDLKVIEDAAQGICCTLDEQPLGSFADYAAISFHETKNVTCGEGGALLVNDEDAIDRAHIVRAKGTNRQKFLQGQVDKYTWVDLGSSYPCSDLTAAFLWGQLEMADAITARRLEIWNTYYEAFEDLEKRGDIRRPVIPENAEHNAHMFYLILPSRKERDSALDALRELGIHAVFHYIPLHSAPAGLEYGRVSGSMSVTDDLSGRLLRLPLWYSMSDDEISSVVEAVQTLGSSVIA